MSKKSRTARSAARKSPARKASTRKAPSKKATRKATPKPTPRTSSKARRKPDAKATPTKAPGRKSTSKARAKKAPRKPSPTSRPMKQSARATPTQTIQSPSRTAVALLIAYMKFCHATTEQLLTATPDEHALAQLPGADNHKAWTLGHHAISQAWFASMLTGTMPTLPESYNALFGIGSIPQSDPTLYPPLEELKSYWKSTFNSLIDAAEAITDEDLSSPPAQESGGFITSKFDALAKAAWHDGWHAGQLAALRRGLGLPPALG